MPEAVAQYRILDRTGSRAMGDIYRARDTRLGRVNGAIKAGITTETPMAVFVTVPPTSTVVLERSQCW